MRHSERQGQPFSGPDAPTWPWLKVFYTLIGWPALKLFRVRSAGIERIPEGACVIAGNHVSYLDPVVLWALRPKGYVHFVAKSELYRFKPLAWLFDNAGAMPVERGTADRKMIARATALLKGGERVAIFPEGTRGRGRDDFEELGEAHQGVAFLAQHAGVPVVPLGIAGTDKVMPKGARLPRFPRVAVVFGEPLSLDNYEGDRREKLAALTADTMKQIELLREEARKLAE